MRSFVMMKIVRSRRRIRRNDGVDGITCLLIAAAIVFSAAAELSAAADTMTIVAFGDSTTATRGGLAVYPDLLQKDLTGRGMPVRVVNAGVGGNHTSHALARIDKDVLAHQPDVVIVQFGINDSAVDVWKNPPANRPRITLSTYEDNLRQIIRVLRQSDVSVVLMTPNPLRWTTEVRQRYGKRPYLPDTEDGFNIILSAYAEKVRQIADHDKLPLVDVYRLFEEFGRHDGQSVSDLLLDGIHPNQHGHQLVFHQLRRVLQTIDRPRARSLAAAVDLKITSNPAVSILDKEDSETTHIRFEDYVSNPPPGSRDPLQGWIGRFAIPFKGLAKPDARHTSVKPLPPPIGMLIESGSDSMGFYDPSSRVDCADARADKLIFRFVDPENTARAATVSRFALRMTGTSVSSGKVRFSLHDISGKTLASRVAVRDPRTRQAVSEIDCEAWAGEKHTSVIHKVVVQHTGTGYFVVGSVTRPEQSDIAFRGFTVREQAVRRPLGEQIPVAHADQWQQRAKAELITDMTLCLPASAWSERRDHGRWKVFEYETEKFSGKSLSVGRESSAPDLTLKLQQQGWHAVYIGLSTITDLVRPDQNQIEAKFSGDPSYTRLSNRLDLASGRRDVLEEVFLGAADLSKNDLQFSTVYQRPARIHYVRLIPLAATEVADLLADRKQTLTRTSVATFDGFTWIHPFRPQGRADLAATFAPYRHSDFKTWWFQVGGADLVHHPTSVGNLMGGHLNTFPRSVDREYVESVRHLHAQGIDPLRVAVEEAHAQDAEILICLRAAGWKGAPPWEEFFMSRFYEAHPEWRCIDYDGTPTMHLSYAVEEVQDHLIDVLRETLQRGADGAGFLFHRGMPMILWEEPFCQRFHQIYGEDPREIAEDDPRVYRLRAEIVTRFIRKIRAMLEETRLHRGHKQPRLKLAVSTFATRADNEKFGLDVERWIEEDLIDQIGIAWFAYHTSGLKTKSGDTRYYARITEGTAVKIYPFYVGWKMNSAVNLISNVNRDYSEGADGIAIWDPNQFTGWLSGKNPYWPLVSRLGHRDQLRNGSLLYKPVPTPLKRLGENHYSRWYPNTGF